MRQRDTRRPSPTALLAAAHPGPTAVVTLVTLGLAVAVGAPPIAAALLTAGMLAGQLSVGWSNDWLDAARDVAARRTDKPVAEGAVPVETVRTAAFVALAPGLVLPLLASPPSGMLHLLFVASAWSYNLGLKATPASVLPYVVSFGSLPALVTLLPPHPALPPVWATVVGAAFGVAAHFANVVPDVAADRRAGSRGLPQLLGARASGVTAAVVLLAAAVVVAVAGRPAWPVGLLATLAAVGCAVVGLLVGLRPRPGRAPFRAVMAAALCLVVALLAAGSALR
jgi:4-hydroxybenzoate polyprenyltransferase